MRQPEHDIYKELRKNRNITLTLFALMVVMTLSFSFFMYKTYNDSISNAFIFDKEGERLPLSWVNRNKVVEVEIKDHLRLWFERYYSFDQNNYVEQRRSALPLITVEDWKALETYYEEREWWEQVALNNIRQKTTLVPDSFVMEGNEAPFSFSAEARMEVTAGNGPRSYYLLSVSGKIDYVTPTYPENPHGLIIMNYRQKPLKQMDKQQLAIVIVLASVALFIGGYALYVFGDDQPIEETRFAHKEEKPYQSMFDLIEQEDNTSAQNVSRPSSAYDFDQYLVSDDVRKDLIIDSLQLVIDSLLSVQTRKTYIPSRKAARKPIEQPEKQAKIPVEEERTFSSAIMEEEDDPVVAHDELIKAVVHGEHKIRSSEYIKLRTTEESYIDGVKLPANFFMTGKASFSNDRIFVTISSLKHGDRLMEVSFEIFDSGDGIRGIYVEGGLEQQIAEESIRDAVSGVRVNVPMIGGISTNAVRRKAEDISVVIPSEYKVLLKSR
jgi:hypothetical protein